jgi:MFS family permease
VSSEATPLETPPPEGAIVRGGALALLRVFRHRNYRLFFAGQLVSLMGTWMQSVAQGWLVYSMTHSPFLLGLTSFAGQVPVFFITAFGGTISDRVDKRRLLIVTQTLSMVQATVLAGLTLSGVVQVWEVIALAFSMGLINSFDVPTRQAFTIEMVGREDLRNAIALNSVMFNLARVIGPTLAGLLIALAGEGVCFALNAISYAAVLAGLIMMHIAPRPRHPAKHPLRELAAGAAYAWHTRQIRVSLMLVAVSSCFGAAYIPLMPAVARDVLHQHREVSAC